VAKPKDNAVARRGPSPMKAKYEKAKAGVAARWQRIKLKEKKLKSQGAGAVATYLSADWWGKREAVADQGGKSASFKLGNFEVDGTKAGFALAVAGIMGVTKDGLYDGALYGAGLGIVGAKRGIDAYKKRLAEPPANGGG
jgi:hypothetical protein